MLVLELAKGWVSLLEGDAREHLEREARTAFLQRQRWYAGKVRVLDSLGLMEPGPATRA
jgi:hypothetical protein